jgi:hypothetical protein
VATPKLNDKLQKYILKNPPLNVNKLIKKKKEVLESITTDTVVDTTVDTDDWALDTSPEAVEQRRINSCSTKLLDENEEIVDMEETSEEINIDDI